MLSKLIRLLVSSGVLAAVGPCLQAQSHKIDPAFAPQFANETTLFYDIDFAALADGSLLARGDFTQVNGNPSAGLVRLQGDGTAAPGFATAFNRRILVATPVSGGRFIAFTAPLSGSDPARLERYLANGTPDSTYAAVDFTEGSILRFIPQADGRVLVYGLLRPFGALPNNYGLIRFNADGTRDGTLAWTPFYYEGQLTGSALATMANGQFISSGMMLTNTVNGLITSYTLRRMNADGSQDSSFNFRYDYKVLPGGARDYTLSAPAIFHALAVLPDGRVLAGTGGNFLRFGTDGLVDKNFAPAIPQLSRIDQLVSLGDGRLVVQARLSPVAGTAAQANPALAPSAVLLIDGDGNILRDFRPAAPAGASLELVAVQPDGHLLLRYGQSVYTSGQSAATLLQPTWLRCDLSGQVDPAFALSFTRVSLPTFTKIGADASGRVVVSGNFSRVNGLPRKNLARFLPDGSLDGSFVPWTSPTGHGPLQWVQPDGRLIVREAIVGAADPSGSAPVKTVAQRLQADGSLDASFQAGDLPADAVFHAMDASGAFYASGFDPAVAGEAGLKIYRLNADGSRAATLTTTFAGWANPDLVPRPNPITGIEPLPGGKVMLAAGVKTINGTITRGFARLNADGSTDGTYQPQIAAPIAGSRPAVMLESGGRVLYTEPVYPAAPPATTIRLLADGTRDTTFIALPGAPVSPAFELSDGTLVAANAMKRWLPNGLPDLNWGIVILVNQAGVNSTSSGTGLLSSLVDASGTIYISGDFTLFNGVARAGLGRLLPQETPGITAQPESRTAFAGRSVVFQGALGTTTPATYQWTFNGTPISGATNAALVLNPVSPGQAGDYRLIATTGGQTYTSQVATLTVAPNTARLANFSARSLVSSNLPPQIGGFVLRGQAARPVLLRAVGRGLAQNAPGVALLPSPVLHLQQLSTKIAEDTGGILAPAIADVARRVGAFAPGPSPYDPAVNYGSALSLPLDPGVYTAVTSSADNRSGVSLFEFYDVEASSSNPVVNCSLRGSVGTGDAVHIAGFVVIGDGPITMLIRGIGPALMPLGVPGAISDPQLMLYRGSALYAANDNWSDTNGAAIAAAAQTAGAFALPAGSRDAAVLLTLEPGAYSVQVSGVGDVSGEALVELYVVP